MKFSEPELSSWFEKLFKQKKVNDVFVCKGKRAKKEREIECKELHLFNPLQYVFWMI